MDFRLGPGRVIAPRDIRAAGSGVSAWHIAVVTIAGLTTLGTKLNTTYGNIATDVLSAR